MRTDASTSKYQEHPVAKEEWNRRELRHLRFMLRRLRFLEKNAEDLSRSNEAQAANAAVFVETELEALEWLLTEIGFLQPTDGAVS